MHRRSLLKLLALPALPSLAALPQAHAAGETGASAAEPAQSSRTVPWTELPEGAAPGGGLWETEVDVAVIGSGAAGFAAAVSALESGAKRVAILEKFPSAGGHTIVSSGSFAAVQGETDIRHMTAAIVSSGGGESDPVLARRLAADSWQARAWLEHLGVHWISMPFRAVGSPVAWNYATGSAQSGYDYIQTASRAFKKLGGQIFFRTRAVKLLLSHDPAAGGRPAIAGVYAETERRGRVLFRAPAVVIAAGGFAASREMIHRWRPDIDPRYPTTANALGELLDGAEGEGIAMAEAAGAALTGMRFIDVVPFAGGRLTDYVGGEIWINGEGRRFVSEGESFEVIREQILKQPNARMCAVSDVKSSKGATLPVKLMSGTVSSAGSVAELARGIGVPAKVLAETLERYNRSVKNGWDEQFNRPIAGQLIDSPPYFYGPEIFSIHYTSGGIRISERAEALDTQGGPIPGLYAAGETTGGVHGKTRLGGCSLTDCFVFGRIAGRQAALRAAQAANAS